MKPKGSFDCWASVERIERWEEAASWGGRQKPDPISRKLRGPTKKEQGTVEAEITFLNAS